MHPSVHFSTVYYSQDMEAEEWIKEMVYICIYNGILLRH